ncbi:MAG TPA: adenosylcobinamide-GDP ribazoletransferase [Ktedonobacterales bacterium]|nr:adenosylcobinamide-GDP ribazoletransferase [Ktedonobacterales bacterium]
MTPGKWRGSPLAGLALAVEFLTVLPVRRAHVDELVSAEPPDMARALPWFPLAGALLGLAFVGLDWALAFAFPPGIRAVALLAFDALVTGMLHLDGFVDCCDALLGTRTVERRLEILRDSRVGAYGALGGALLLIAKFAALTALVSGPVRVLTLLVAPILGRWGMVYAVTRYPYARAAGAGAPFRNRGMSQLILASVVMLLLLAASALIVGGRGTGIGATLTLAVLLLVAALLVLLGWLAWASRRLGGGLTGDTYGAACVLAELAVLLLAPPLAELAFRIVGG